MARRNSLKIVLAVASIIMASCSGAKNYKDAYGVIIDSKKYLKLLGERVPIPHNLSTLGQTYKDSILIRVPSFSDGVIEGNKIPVEKGNYNFSGQIAIKGNHIKVNLLIDDIADKMQRPCSWNGEYKFIKSLK